MKRLIPLLLIALLLPACGTLQGPSARGIDRALDQAPSLFLEQAVLGPQGDGTYVVPSSQVVEPAGDTTLFPGRPTAVALQPGGNLLAVQNRTELGLIDATTREVFQMLSMPKGGTSFTGLAWRSDGKRVWVTDATQAVHAAEATENERWKWVQSIELPGPNGKGEAAPGGFFLDEPNNRMYITLSRNNTVAVVNLESGIVEQEIPVGIAPYTVARHGNKAYVTNWGGRRPKDNEFTANTSGSRILVDPETGIANSGTVSVIDLAANAVTKEIEVDLHPCGMAFAPNGARLYVANANSDTISVIDTKTDRLIGALGAKPMASLPFGSAPNALTVSPDGNTLYVANGGNNAIAVISLATGTLAGLIPTGWYPGDVILSPDAETLIVANVKGVGSRALDSDLERKERYFGPLGAKTVHGYNTHEHMGSISFIPVPDAQALEAHTYAVARNMRLPLMHQVMTASTVPERITPLPISPGEKSPIKHILYIIKENRTYDQILGDLPQGNGDPALCHFPREVTPNHHALAEEFVLLDNFYCNGILSADGHQWTNEGYVVDYLEKSFGGFSRSYPYDGDDALAYASSGFIWDYVLAKGLTLRNYGEFVRAQITPKATWSEIYADYTNGTKNITIQAIPQIHTLEPYSCPDFVGFPGTVQDVYRAQSFIRELNEAEAKGEWYNFMIMLLPNDHTVGTREGYPTPRAAVADNDLALGRIVEAVSHSRFWPETAIFVVQDDPQAGLDHVDGHRTAAFCISPYTKRGHVDSTHYNQTGMLRTMELILGLPPMNQIDMASTPMTGCFQEEQDLTPYTARPNEILLDEMNPKVASLSGKQKYYAQQSMEMDLDEIDKANEELFNRVIWHSVKGYNTPYPKLAQRKTIGENHWGYEVEDEDD